jgi:lipopolysaccharide/colanic/teichoic acid biosynthesis glycosyltransferase
MKRLFDILVSLLGLLVLSPVFLLVAFLIKLDSRGLVFFRQERIGKGFRPFHIYKFRTMVEHAPRLGGSITVGKDPRVTKTGAVLRRTKIDELPQLINVLAGDMSLVGPRPEVRKYVELFRSEYEQILKVRPGITDLASLKYEDEAELLANSADPDQEYVTRVLPDKLRLARDYVNNSSFFFDVLLILRTLPKLFGCRPSGRSGGLRVEG